MKNLVTDAHSAFPPAPKVALQMIDGKARLVSDLICDGLGACLGHRPQPERGRVLIMGLRISEVLFNFI